MKTWNEVGRPIEHRDSDSTDVLSNLCVLFTSLSAAKDEQTGVILGQLLAQLGCPFIPWQWHGPASWTPLPIGPWNIGSSSRTRVWCVVERWWDGLARSSKPLLDSG